MSLSRRSKQTLTFEDYLECLKDQNIIRDQDHRIQSKKQKISTSLVHKIALTSFCDKVRVMIDSSVTISSTFPPYTIFENERHIRKQVLTLYEYNCINIMPN